MASPRNVPLVHGTAAVGLAAAARLGSRLGQATVVVGLAALVAGLTTPPRSGPFCRAECIGYPYTDAAAFVPRDYWWMYPQSLLILLVLALLICIHRTVTPSTRVFSDIAVGFAAVAATALLIDYAIQLAVLQPSLLRGQTAALSAFSQYNPHSVFIALEDLGYLLIGLALVAVASVFTSRSPLERTLRWLLGAGGALTVVALPALAIAYRADVEYRFEVVAIGLTWVSLIGGGVLLPLWFRRQPTVSPPPADVRTRADAQAADRRRAWDAADIRPGGGR